MGDHLRILLGVVVHSLFLGKKMGGNEGDVYDDSHLKLHIRLSSLVVGKDVVSDAG